MKGTFFQKPLEFRIALAGESWPQGTSLTGTLTVKNHGPSPVSGAEIPVRLALGSLKNVRAKSAGAFTLVAEQGPKAGFTVAPGAEAAFEWSLPIDRNAVVTDASTSLYLVYGRGELSAELGQLQLFVVPGPEIAEFLKDWAIHFRFSVKSIKSHKGWVEAKMAPPAARSFGFVDHAVGAFRVLDSGALAVKITFVVKKIDATSPALQSVKEKREYEVTLEPAQLRLPSGRLNPDTISEVLRKAVDLVDSKIAF